MRSKIISTGSFVPPLTITNDDMSKLIDTSDDWIFTRTGIRERRVSDIPAWEMGQKAAENALKDADIDALELDLIIVSTVTPDYSTPSISCVIQGLIGAKNAACFDINAACSGFVYAIDMADVYIKSGRAKNVLIICTQRLSAITDYTDRATCVLFGDGAGAVIMKPCGDNVGVLSTYIAADGAAGGMLVATNRWGDNPFTSPVSQKLFANGDTPYIHMDGQEVFKFATRAMTKSCDEALKRAGVSMSDIKFLFPHQANKRIIDFVTNRYKLGSDKVALNIDKYANTSCASIPLLLDEKNRTGELKDGDLCLFVGFGGGMTCGSVLVRW